MAGKLYNDNSKMPKSSNLYTSMRGVTDFGNLAQFDLFESGYSFFNNINGPDFMKQIQEHKALLDVFILILENEFKGLDGLDDMTGETSEITDGVSTMQLITKVTEANNTTVTTAYTEKSGRTITKTVELFLRGLKDPRSQAKTYNGALNASYKAEYSKEVFNHLYIVTDNTMMNLEASYLLLNAQPPKAELSILNSTKGDIQFRDLGLDWNCFPVRGPQINLLAQKYLDELNTFLNKNSGNFNWSISNGPANAAGSVNKISDLEFKAENGTVKVSMKKR